MTYIVISFLVILNVATGLLLRRSLRLNLQFDEIFGRVGVVLGSYGEELKRTLSGGLLEDHPEVAAFHKLNMRNMEQIEAIAVEISVGRPKPQRRPKLPSNFERPLVE